MPHLKRIPSKHDRRAFIACTSFAIAVIVGVWAWTVRMTVLQGMSGAKDVLSNVTETAGTVREQTQPDLETVSAVKAGLQRVIERKATENAERQGTVDAVAEMMSDGLGGTTEASVSSVSDESAVKE